MGDLVLVLALVLALVPVLVPDPDPEQEVVALVDPQAVQLLAAGALVEVDPRAGLQETLVLAVLPLVVPLKEAPDREVRSPKRI